MSSWSRGSGYRGVDDEAAPAYGDNPVSRPRKRGVLSWIKEHPIISAVVVLAVIGLAVGLGVGLGTKDKNNGDEDAQDPTQTDYSVTFQVMGTPGGPAPSCAALQEGDTLTTYSAEVQAAVAAALNMTGPQVLVRTVQCGDLKLFVPQQAAGGRRFLQQTQGNSLQLTIMFRVAALPGAPKPPSVAAITAALQAHLGKLVMQQATNKALGVPLESVSVLTVVAVPSTSDSGAAEVVTSPPPAAPSPSPSALPVEVPAPTPSPSPSPVYGGYGGYGSPAPSPSPAYGGYGGYGASA